MRVAITGATGMIGTALSRGLSLAGHHVIPVSRKQVAGGALWDPSRHDIDTVPLAGIDAMIHLAGESIAGERWTRDRKVALRNSRVPVTRWLADTLVAMRPRPRLFISASAVGIYGSSRGDEILDERSTLGGDFLATLATDWEAAATPAQDAGIRVVHPRFGIVLSPSGGALAKMILPFRLGLGGPMGPGRQWVSWISIDDLIGAVQHLLSGDALAGPVNFTAPNPVMNAEFAAALGRALRRPAVAPLPAFALRLALGEMADETLLASQRAVPSRLMASGFDFRFPEIAGALAHLFSSRS